MCGNIIDSIVLFKCESHGYCHFHTSLCPFAHYSRPHLGDVAMWLSLPSEVNTMSPLRVIFCLYVNQTLFLELYGFILAHIPRHSMYCPLLLYYDFCVPLTEFLFLTYHFSFFLFFPGGPGLSISELNIFSVHPSVYFSLFLPFALLPSL